MQPSQFIPAATSDGFGRRTALKGLAAACAGGVSSYPLAAMAQAAGVEASPGAVQAWDKRFAGTGFHPGNTAEQNREALAALWKYMASLEEESRFVAFLPGVHELRGSFSPSGTEPKANRRGGARMVLYFPGTTLRFRGNREDFNQMRLMHEGDSIWHELDEFDVRREKPYRGTWGNQKYGSTLMQSPTQLKKLGVAFDVRACGDVSMYGCLRLVGPGNGGRSPATAPAVVGMGASGGQNRGQDSGMMRGAFAGQLVIQEFLVGMGALTVWGISGGPGEIQGSGQADVWTNASFDHLSLDQCVHGIVCDNNHFDMVYVGHLRHLCRFPSYLNTCHGSSIGGGSFIQQNSGVSYVRNEKIVEMHQSSLAIGNFYGRTPGPASMPVGNRAYCLFNIGDGSSLKLGCFHSDMVDPYGSGCFFIMGETDAGITCRRAMFDVSVVDRVTDASPNEAILGIVPFPDARRYAHVVSFGEGESGCAAVKVLPRRGQPPSAHTTNDYLDVFSERHGGRKIYRIVDGALSPRKIVED